MTLPDFTKLDEIERLEIFWNGVYIGERSSGEFKIICHQVYDFYVESKSIGGHYLGMRVFRNTDLLQPYFDQMPEIKL